jgi:hypothetical protein
MVAATCIMSMTWTTLGKDWTGRKLQCESARMAKRRGLYDQCDELTVSQLDYQNENVRRAAAATAWSSFTFHMQAEI